MSKISRRNFLKASALSTVCLATPWFLMACGTEGSQDKHSYLDQTADNISILSRAGFMADHYHVSIPEMDREYHYVVVADLHIIVDNEEIREDVKDIIRARYEQGFVNDQGIRACDLWKNIVTTLNKMDIDGIILAADMIDFYSEANMACLREGCAQLKAPFMLLRADHDYIDSYVQETPWEVIEAAHKTIDAHEDVMVMEQNEFLIVGVNNTTSQLTEAAFHKLEDIFAMGKPIIMVMHVPFASQVDDGLAAASREKWNGLELLWDYNGFPFYVGEYGERLLDLVCAPDSPVVEVFAGHLHIPYDGLITETVHQHVFDASHKGTLGYVTVGPK